MRLLAYALALSVIIASAIIMWPRNAGIAPERPGPARAPALEGRLATDQGKVERGLLTLLIARLVRADRADLLLRRD
jgi:hypothetical protein